MTPQEIEALKAERDELAAQVESLRSSIDDSGLYKICQSLSDVLNKTPQQCLREAQADAVIAAIDAHRNNVMTFGFHTAIKVTDLIKYAATLRQGGAE